MADNENSIGAAEERAGRDLGAKLREARESRNLSIEEIATELRIEAHLLRALEECRFDAIGAPVFAKGYLKQYGTRLGLDYRQLLGDYYDIVGRTEVEIAPSRAIKLRDERQITVWVIAAIAIGLLAVFLLLWWLDQPGGVGSFLPTSSVADGRAASVGQRPAGSTPSDAVADADARGAAARGGLAGAGFTATEPAAAESPAAPRGVEPTARGAELAAGAEPATRGAETAAVGAETAPAAATTTVAAAGAGAQSAAPIDPRAMRVELSFTEDCWAEITDAAGERHFFGLAAPGRRESFAALPPIRFSLGNAGGVEITINGRPYPVPGPARSGDVARFYVNAITD